MTEWTWLGLGGNLGGDDAVAARIADAQARIEALAGTAGRRSSLWRSAPTGPVADQPWFVNAVLALAWQPADADALLAELAAIETDHGRRRDVAQGPRTLDLDILLVGRRVIASPRLQVPHPRLGERRFVLEPMRELAGDDFALPDGRRLGALLAVPAIAAQAVTRLA